MTDIGGKKWELEAIIANAASVSASVQLNNGTLVGLIVPATWTTADITFQGSRDGTNWNNLRDAEGTELTAVVSAAGDWIVLPAGAFHGFEYIRFRSGTSETPVAQGAARTLVAVFRAFG